MKGSSKVIMGATLAMVVSLAIVLALVLVLLAELYCSLLLRRRQPRTPSNTTSTSATITTTSTTDSSLSQSPQPQNQSPSLPLSSYYAHGVLLAPRSFLFPEVSPNKENKMVETRKEHHRVLEVLTQELNPSLSPQQLGLMNASPPSAAFVSSPHQAEEIPIQIRSSNACSDKECAGCGEHFVYISNPIYDNDASRPSRAETPYETPDSSPSRLEIDGSSSGEEEIASPSAPHPVPVTPPLTPMKKLPAEACSVSLRDVRSLGTSGSDSVSNNGLSSSSSGSPCTSPSW
ncbi:hypothetical protein OIU85_012662 [Salix viminalis]|uniref:Uncharacterized protein n=1 Tax=Salix viminalis TaxID=40686 RepID=A0A6N2KU00_SALVM|nr:hypothetical protein OIU85_012662 [Salix viminalis]